MAALTLAANGLSPAHPRTRQTGPRAHPRHLGPVAPRRPQPRIQRPVRRGRRRHLLRRQALQRHQGPPPPDPQTAHRVRRSRRAGGNPHLQQTPHRHVPTRHRRGSPSAPKSKPWAANTAFRARVEDILLDANRHIRGLTLASGEQIDADAVILAIGHSARDTFAMLHRRGVHIEAKPFSIGARIEHPQSLIDRARFGAFAGHPTARCRRLQTGAPRQQRPLGLQLLHVPRRPRRRRHVGNRLRRHQRHEPVFARRVQRQRRHRRGHKPRGLCVGITPADYPADPLAGIAFQQHWERAAYRAGGSTYAAPAQRVGDLLGRPRVHRAG